MTKTAGTHAIVCSKLLTFAVPSISTERAAVEAWTTGRGPSEPTRPEVPPSGKRANPI
jgi:hypothetical protein